MGKLSNRIIGTAITIVCCRSCYSAGRFVVALACFVACLLACLLARLLACFRHRAAVTARVITCMVISSVVSGIHVSVSLDLNRIFVTLLM